MADRFISDTAKFFQLGQTVFAKVTNLDEEKRRFLVTLKITEVMSPESEPQTRLINGLKEMKAAAEMMATRGTTTEDFIGLKVPFVIYSLLVMGEFIQVQTSMVRTSFH